MSNLLFSENLSTGYLFQIYDERPDFDLFEVNQIHGDAVIEGSFQLHQADGIFTKNLNLPLAIKTADCLPIAVLGEKGFALLHAGWRGVQKKIVLAENVRKIVPTYFYVGPHIQKDHFEVKESFRNEFLDSRNFVERHGKIYFNLASELRDQIKQVFPSAKIMMSEVSTFNHPTLYSYRQSQTSSRNWNILAKES